MLDPYRMIVVNIIMSLLLAGGLFVYKYIYPKKNINLLYLLILISILPIVSILRKGTYESGGFSDYVKFSMSFYNTFIEGNIIPQWDSLRCQGFGCPQFVFMYIFPYYFISFLHILGLSFINSAKLLLGLSFVLSGVTMYAFIKDEFGKKAGFIGGIFYLFAPYHLVDLHFRTDVGELPGFVFVPLLFLTTNNIIKKSSTKWVIIQAITLMLLLLSHQAIFLMIIPFLFCYGICKWRNMDKKIIMPIKLFLLSFVLFILLSAFYWLPIVLEAKYIFWGMYGDVLFVEPISIFFLSPWRFGFLFQGPKGELSFIIGYLHLCIVAVTTILLIRKAKFGNSKKDISFFIVSFFVAFFMMLSLSKDIWDIIPFLNKSQFSYRLLLPIAFFTSVIAAILLRKLSFKWILIICIAATLSTILNWGHRRTIPTIDDAYLKRELRQSSIPFEVTVPKWVDLKHPEQYKRLTDIEVTSGMADIKTLQRKTTMHEYLILAKTDVTVRENTFYYPGWQVYMNDKPVTITYNTPKLPGTINFSLKRGFYKVETSFSNTTERNSASLISAITAIIILFWAIRRRKTYSKQN